jgi:zinc protease
MDGQAAYLAAWEAEGDVALGAAYYDRLLSATPQQVQEATRRHLDPSQVSLFVYRPRAEAPLPVSTETMPAWLAEAATAAAANAASTAPVIPKTPAAPALAHGVHVHHTPRGVPVLVKARPGTPLVNIGVFVRGGAVAEPAHAEGLARLMAHGTLKGTTSRSGDAIALDAESLGGSVGVSAALESIGWTMSVPVRHLEPALALLADVIQRPTVPDAGLDTERQLAIAEVERQRDDMYRFPMRLAVEAAYRGHPYARSVLGSVESLGAITRDQVLAQHERTVRGGASVARRTHHAGRGAREAADGAGHALPRPRAPRRVALRRARAWRGDERPGWTILRAAARSAVAGVHRGRLSHRAACRRALRGVHRHGAGA